MDIFQVMDMALSDELSCLQIDLVKGEAVLPENVLAFLLCVTLLQWKPLVERIKKICQSSSRALHLFLTLGFYSVGY